MIKSLSFLSALLLIPFSYGAEISREFLRWQASEYMATLRYQQHGIATPGINDIYVSELDKFVQLQDTRIGIICPGTTGGTIAGEWTFFGARFLPLIGSEKPSFYSLSYLGGATAFHQGNSYDALITPADIQTAIDKNLCPAKEAGISKTHVGSYGFKHLTKNSHFSPLSWGSADLDSDGIGDFTVGGVLYLSSNEYNKPIGDNRLGAEAAFVRTDNGVRLVRLYNEKLFFERLDGNNLVTEASVNVEGYISNAGHSLIVLPGKTEGTDSIAVRQPCGLKPLFYEKAQVNWGLGCLSDLESPWALPGGRGDFDGDGVEDFWISQTFLGTNASEQRDSVTLVSGAAYLSLSLEKDISNLALMTISGSAKFTDYDGIATTLSPFAGDIDGDGIPDLSFSGHRHMNEAGALYIFYGKDLEEGTHINIEDESIDKIVGPLMAQLAPPYHHWDATDWDNDGYDDIVITADNDPLSGFNAGAMYILSGRMIKQFGRKE